MIPRRIRKCNMLLPYSQKEIANTILIIESNCRQAAYDRMLCQLAQCEFTVKKSEFATKMMENELKNYRAISKTIDSGIEHAKVQIEQSKQNLVLAKKIRKNRMEYDALAKVISQQPDRKETTKKLEILNKELDELKDSRKQLQHYLEMRRNEFTVLMRSIRELQSKLENSSSIEQEIDLENEQNERVTAVENMSVDGDGELPDSPGESPAMIE